MQRMFVMLDYFLFYYTVNELSPSHKGQTCEYLKPYKMIEDSCIIHTLLISGCSGVVKCVVVI